MKSIFSKKNRRSLYLYVDLCSTLKKHSFPKIRKNISCLFPIFTNKIKLFQATGYIKKTHRNNNINQTLTYIFKLNRNFITMMVSPQSSIFQDLKINK